MNELYQLLSVATSSTMSQITGVGFVIGLLALLPLVGISMYLARVRRWVTKLSITPSSPDAYATPTDRQRARVERNLPDSASGIRIYVDETATESVRADAMGFLVSILGCGEYGERSMVFSKAAFHPENRSKLPGLIAHESEHFRQKDTRERAILIDVGAIGGLVGVLGLFAWLYGIIGRDPWLFVGSMTIVMVSGAVLRLSSARHRDAEYRADAAASAYASRRSILELLEDYANRDTSDSEAPEDILLGTTHPASNDRIGELTKPLAECEGL